MGKGTGKRLFTRTGRSGPLFGRFLDRYGDVIPLPEQVLSGFSADTDWRAFESEWWLFFTMCRKPVNIGYPCYTKPSMGDPVSAGT